MGEDYKTKQDNSVNHERIRKPTQTDLRSREVILIDIAAVRFYPVFILFIIVVTFLFILS